MDALIMRMALVNSIFSLKFWNWVILLVIWSIPIIIDLEDRDFRIKILIKLVKGFVQVFSKVLSGAVFGFYCRDKLIERGLLEIWTESSRDRTAFLMTWDWWGSLSLFQVLVSMLPLQLFFQNFALKYLF